MHTPVHVHTHIHAHGCTYTHSYTRTHTYTHTCAHAHCYKTEKFGTLIKYSRLESSKFVSLNDIARFFSNHILFKNRLITFKNEITHLKFASKIIQGIGQEEAVGNTDEVGMLMDLIIIEFVKWVNDGSTYSTLPFCMFNTFHAKLYKF